MGRCGVYCVWCAYGLPVLAGVAFLKGTEVLTKVTHAEGQGQKWLCPFCFDAVIYYMQPFY
jgi:hypothetical protein